LENASVIFLSVIDENKGIIYKVANAYCKDQEDRKDSYDKLLTVMITVINIRHGFTGSL
jgi:hypothetical protein